MVRAPAGARKNIFPLVQLSEDAIPMVPWKGWRQFSFLEKIIYQETNSLKPILNQNYTSCYNCESWSIRLQDLTVHAYMCEDRKTAFLYILWWLLWRMTILRMFCPSVCQATSFKNGMKGFVIVYVDSWFLFSFGSFPFPYIHISKNSRSFFTYRFCNPCSILKYLMIKIYVATMKQNHIRFNTQTRKNVIQKTIIN